uniref:Pentapeptide repeat-containing protein n=1 Tax=Amicula sp. isolate GU52X-4 cfCalB7 TaxID=3003489 RepID=A0A9E8YZ59_9STRA|nr:hypothetical protein [Amicula sp. isolate GU52X-4 cfCalB7]
MINKFEKIIENQSQMETLVIRDGTFSNEIIFEAFLQCSIFGTLTFHEINFERVDFTGSNFVNCKFKNCQFKDVIFRKCEFWKSTFENCTIEKSDLTRASFSKGAFQNCNFLKVNLRGSDFLDFELIDTIFTNSILDLIGASQVNIWKSNQCTDVQDSLNLGDFLEHMD